MKKDDRNIEGEVISGKKVRKFRIRASERKMVDAEIKYTHQNLLNKVFLGIFLFVAVSALIMRIASGALLDFGYVGDKYHFGFWDGPEHAFKGEYDEWAKTVANPTWALFLKAHDDVASIISRHPNFLWLLTQFTWLTTLVIIVYLVFRFFKYDDHVPRWLKWIMTQRTLSLVTMYDLVVGSVFWASMYNGFTGKFSDSIFGLEMTITVLVHAVIPVFMLIYSTIFLIKDKRASLLREMFAVKGLIFPVLYMVYYMILTIIWTDPYPVTNMHNSLMKDPLTGELLDKPNWGAWASEFWKLPFAILGIYIILGLFTLFHNIILINFNKRYDPEHDYGVIYRRKVKLERIKRKAIRKHVRYLEHHQQTED